MGSFKLTCLNSDWLSASGTYPISPTFCGKGKASALGDSLLVEGAGVDVEGAKEDIIGR